MKNTENIRLWQIKYQRIEMFGETRRVPARVFYKGQYIVSDAWDKVFMVDLIHEVDADYVENYFCRMNTWFEERVFIVMQSEWINAAKSIHDIIWDDK